MHGHWIRTTFTRQILMRRRTDLFCRILVVIIHFHLDLAAVALLALSPVSAHAPFDRLHLALDLFFVAFVSKLLSYLPIEVAAALLNDIILATFSGAFEATLSSHALQLVELLHVRHERVNYGGEQAVASQLSSRTYGSSAARTLFLVYAVVVLDAPAAELVHALAHVVRVLVDARAHRAKQRFFQLVERLHAEVLVVVGSLHVLEQPWRGDSLEQIQIYR